ncbi:hypothetical protein ACGE24_03255 [Corynebacterium kroppenstedtii]|uniref:hypothetical protein n=1 Tax=Corynebacterium sp. PCR 32 TaxID=3351342 RepID=UPI0030AB4689
MTVLALLLALMAFVFLVVALLTASKAWAIACIIVGAIGVLIVVIDTMVKRKGAREKTHHPHHRD